MLKDRGGVKNNEGGRRVINNVETRKGRGVMNNEGRSEVRRRSDKIGRAHV